MKLKKGLKMFKDLKRRTRIGFNSLFMGLKGGDKVITQTANFGSDNTSIVQENKVDSVFQDMIDEKETQRAVEMRDAYYRVLREADKYEVTINGRFEDEDGNEIEDSNITATAVKRNKTLLKRIDVYNPENLKIEVIQDIKLIPKQSNFAFGLEELTSSEHDLYIPSVIIERDFIPRFEIERYANKIVVREIGSGKYYLDIYSTIYASQFGEVDALFIAELNRLREQDIKRSDTTSFLTLKFVSDKAFGVEDL